MKESSKPTHNTIGHRQIEWAFNLLLMANGLLSAKQLEKRTSHKKYLKFSILCAFLRLSVQFNAHF